ncbi:hypothetical protein FE257_004186 [Aspergillus nanangensis]|uniref:Rieske domain-containing protein n=1 Tax=Aspergillus nanangensis TaxID=2582783 RepID=A0AAD4CRC9_ASPNN|nr:hypothetical protein FE257_004186 [Aspergillus nanangensis]
MESLSSSLPTTVLIATLTALFFLFRAWPRLVSWNKSDSNLKSTDHTSKPIISEAVSKESDFPLTWWVDSELFELERRAIFSKQWLLLSHRSRFAKVGDYQSFDIAGFSIFLIQGKDGEVRAFHNVCRHRAYTVIKKESGSSAVLGCRYHGWSYNTFGQLIKAPQFDDVPGFDRSQNSLFEVHSHTNGSGFVFINLEADLSSEMISAGPLDTFSGRNGLDTTSKWVGGKALMGEFNWKFGLRRKELVEAVKLERETSRQNSMPLVMKLIDRFRRPSESLSTLPFSSVHTVNGTECWYSLSLIPITERKVSVRYDVYCFKNTAPFNCEYISQALEKFLNEAIHELETEYQECASGAGVVTSPYLDLQEIDAQKHILDQVKAHSKIEKIHGAEVLPAVRKPRNNTKFQQAEQLCKELDCLGSSSHGDLSW